MKGKELIDACLDGEDVSAVLADALKQYVLTGISLNDILGFRATTTGGNTPRKEALLSRRGCALLDAFFYLRKQHPALSERQICAVLLDLLAAPDEVPPDISAAINDINAYSAILGIKYSNVTSVYNAIVNIRYALTVAQE